MQAKCMTVQSDMSTNTNLLSRDSFQLSKFKNIRMESYQKLSPKSPHSSDELLADGDDDNEKKELGRSYAISTVVISAVPATPFNGTAVGFTTGQKQILAGLMISYLGGASKGDFGTILSMGYFIFALGKFIQGLLIDKYGGKLVLQLNLAMACTIIMVMTLLPADREHPSHYLALFGVLWCINRMVQSGGWGSIVSIISKTFAPSSHGKAIGLATVSYGLGDAAVRMILGSIMEADLKLISSSTSSTGTSGANPKHLINPSQAEQVWKHVFFSSSIFGFCCLFLSYLLIRFSAKHSVFYSEYDVTTMNHHYNTDLHHVKATSVLGLLKRLGGTIKFWILLILCFCMTFIRETVLTWLSTFLSEYLRVDDGQGAMLSLLFPLFGSLSTVYGGYLLDRTRPENRGKLLVHFLCAVFAVMSIASFSMRDSPISGSTIASGSSGLRTAIVSILVSALAFFMMAPFVFVDTIFPLDLCSPSEVGVTVGLMNFAGYIGAILAGRQIGALIETFGWISVIHALWLATGVSFAIGCVYWRIDHARFKSLTAFASVRE